MGKNLSRDRYSNAPSRSSAPSGIKTLPVSPIKTIKGPSIKSDSPGRKSENNDGVDSGTSVVSS